MLFEASSFKRILNVGHLLIYKTGLSGVAQFTRIFNTYQRVKGDNHANIVFTKRLHSAAIVALKRNVTFNFMATVRVHVYLYVQMNIAECLCCNESASFIDHCRYETVVEACTMFR